ncbi:hypothetical protein FACS1894187_03500 [Synergistales bacterium]|nr:hypothetical protein FACS1894187_03500 [Synergistales bacterium]
MNIKLNIKERFANIEDPRHQSYVEHKLCDVLTIVMCAVMSGLDQLLGHYDVRYKQSIVVV